MFVNVMHYFEYFDIFGITFRSKIVRFANQYYYKQLRFYLSIFVLKMAACLPPEILSMILDACAYDKKTLHACILTNRIWHTVAIRHLWARPFTLLYNKRECYIKSYSCERKAEVLMTTFIQSITDVKEITEETSVLTKKYNKEPPFNYNVY